MCSRNTSTGLKFEIKTSIEKKLKTEQFRKRIINNSKYGYYYIYTNNTKTILYMTQNGFKLYFKHYFDINIYRCPDEIFVIIDNLTNEYTFKILEKKNQNVDGTVEDKLKNGNFNRREYKKMLNSLDFPINVEYAFCVSKFLQSKLESNNIKYKNIKEIMKEDNIKIFFGDSENYIEDVFNWFVYLNIA